jgi:glutathione S-transferase
MLAVLFMAGIKFPVTAAVMGLGWSVSRYLYMVGYCSGKEGGKGRYRGITYVLFQMGLLGLTIWNGVTMVLRQ